MTAGRFKALGVALVLLGVALLVYYGPRYNQILYACGGGQNWTEYCPTFARELLVVGAVALVAGVFAYVEGVRRDRSN